MISNDLATALVFVFLVVFLISGMPIGLALLGSAFPVLWLIQGTSGLESIGILFWASLDNFVLITIPMFVLMGNILIYSGLASELIDLFSSWFSRIPSGLGCASVFSCAVFGTMSGSNAAACALIGGIAIPEMRKRGYTISLACGIIAAAGGLAILIPPSTEMIMYSIVSDVSIGKLFMAGVLPGFLLASMMAAYLIITALVRPGSTPPTYSVSWKTRFSKLTHVWPAMILTLSVLGGIYLGVMTPTEAAAVGAFIAWLLVVFYYKTFKWSRMGEAILRTIEVSTMILVVLAGSAIFGYVLALVRFPDVFTAWMLGFTQSKMMILVIIIILLTIAGTFMTVAAMVFIIVPILLPVVTTLGFDPLVFGITFTVICQTSLVTPPVAMNLYVISGIVKDARMVQDIAKGAIPFIIINYILIAIIWIFPQIVVWFPTTMMGR